MGSAGPFYEVKLDVHNTVATEVAKCPLKQLITKLYKGDLIVIPRQRSSVHVVSIARNAWPSHSWNNKNVS